MIEKINPNQIQQVEQTRTREAGFEKQFDECLNKALGETPECKTVGTEIKPMSVTPLHEMVFTKTPDDLAPMEQTLDLMDRLSTALNDPRSTARSLTPLIQNLDSFAQNLIAGAGLLPDGDKAKSLMEQTALTAKVQVSKFQRGDFN